jgi:hypothetical protein
MTDMDVLVLGRHILVKVQQREQVTESVRREHVTQFQLD